MFQYNKYFSTKIQYPNLQHSQISDDVAHPDEIVCKANRGSLRGIKHPRRLLHGPIPAQHPRHLRTMRSRGGRTWHPRKSGLPQVGCLETWKSQHKSFVHQEYIPLINSWRRMCKHLGICSNHQGLRLQGYGKKWDSIHPSSSKAHRFAHEFRRISSPPRTQY